MAHSVGTTEHVKPKVTETWSCLKKAWKEYKMAKLRSDTQKMTEYAIIIRGLELEMGAKQSEFVELNAH